MKPASSLMKIPRLPSRSTSPGVALRSAPSGSYAPIWLRSATRRIGFVPPPSMPASNVSTHPPQSASFTRAASSCWIANLPPGIGFVPQTSGLTSFPTRASQPLLGPPRLRNHPRFAASLGFLPSQANPLRYNYLPHQFGFVPQPADLAPFPSRLRPRRGLPAHRDIFTTGTSNLTEIWDENGSSIKRSADAAYGPGCSRNGWRPIEPACGCVNSGGAKRRPGCF